MLRLACILGLLTPAVLGFARDPQPPSGYQVQPHVYLCPVSDGNYCYSGSLQSMYIIRCRNGRGTLGNCNDISHRKGNESRCYQPDPGIYDAACSTNWGTVYPEDSRDPFFLPNNLKPGPLGQPVPPAPPAYVPCVPPLAPNGPGQGPGGFLPSRPPANCSNNNINNSTNINSNTDLYQDQNQNSSGGPANPGSPPSPPRENPSGGDLSGPDTGDANISVNNNTNAIGDEKKKSGGASRYFGAISKIPDIATDVDFDEMEMDGPLINRQEDEMAEKAAGVRPEMKACRIVVAIAMVAVVLR